MTEKRLFNLLTGIIDRLGRRGFSDHVLYTHFPHAPSAAGMMLEKRDAEAFLRQTGQYNDQIGQQLRRPPSERRAATALLELLIPQEVLKAYANRRYLIERLAEYGLRSGMATMFSCRPARVLEVVEDTLLGDSNFAVIQQWINNAEANQDLLVYSDPCDKPLGIGYRSKGKNRFPSIAEEPISCDRLCVMLRKEPVDGRIIFLSTFPVI